MSVQTYLHQCALAGILILPSGRLQAQIRMLTAGLPRAKHSQLKVESQLANAWSGDKVPTGRSQVTFR